MRRAALIPSVSRSATTRFGPPPDGESRGDIHTPAGNPRPRRRATWRLTSTDRRNLWPAHPLYTLGRAGSSRSGTSRTTLWVDCPPCTTDPLVPTSPSLVPVGPHPARARPPTHGGPPPAPRSGHAPAHAAPAAGRGPRSRPDPRPLAHGAQPLSDSTQPSLRAPAPRPPGPPGPPQATPAPGPRPRPPAPRPYGRIRWASPNSCPTNPSRAASA
jgi:hypothetical protein